MSAAKPAQQPFRPYMASVGGVAYERGWQLGVGTSEPIRAFLDDGLARVNLFRRDMLDLSAAS